METILDRFYVKHNIWQLKPKSVLLRKAIVTMYDNIHIWRCNKMYKR
jgi:hypothetical protein